MLEEREVERQQELIWLLSNGLEDENIRNPNTEPSIASDSTHISSPRTPELDYNFVDYNSDNKQHCSLLEIAIARTFSDGEKISRDNLCSRYLTLSKIEPNNVAILDNGDIEDLEELKEYQLKNNPVTKIPIKEILIVPEPQLNAIIDKLRLEQKARLSANRKQTHAEFLSSSTPANYYVEIPKTTKQGFTTRRLRPSYRKP